MKRYLYSTFVLILLGFLSATLYAPNDPPAMQTKELAIGEERKLNGAYTLLTPAEDYTDWTIPVPSFDPLVPNTFVMTILGATPSVPEMNGPEAGVAALRNPVWSAITSTYTSDIWAKQASSGGNPPVLVGGVLISPGRGNWQRNRSSAIVTAGGQTFRKHINVERASTMALITNFAYDYTGLSWVRVLYGPSGETSPAYLPLNGPIPAGKRLRGWAWAAAHSIPIHNQWNQPANSINGCACLEKIGSVGAYLGDISSAASIDPVGIPQLLSNDEGDFHDAGSQACQDWLENNMPAVSPSNNPPAPGILFRNQEFYIYAGGWLIGNYERDADVVLEGGVLKVRIVYSVVNPSQTDERLDIPTIPPDDNIP